MELLGNDAQKLGLVLRSVAVRRTDVHHLEKDADVERYTKERGDRGSVSVEKQIRDDSREEHKAGEAE